MAIRISELNALSVDLSQSDELPIVDISAAETKKITVANIINIGISGSPSSFIDLGKLNQSSATKLTANALDNTGVASGTYGDAATVAQFIVNNQGLITTATGVPIVIPATSVTGLAPVATSGTYASLSGLPTLGTLAQQDAGNIVVSGGTISGVTFVSGSVTISGGTISGITDLAIEDGGTGASSAADARTNLGLAIGSDVQAYSTVLSGVAEAYDATDNIAYASASGVVATTPFTSFARSMASGATAGDVRSTLGLGSIATQNAGSVVISGGTISGAALNAVNVTISGGTIVSIADLAVEDGGTGASTASGARANLGLAIGADVQSYSSALEQAALAFDTADVFIYSSASGVIEAGSVGSVGLAVLSGASASGVRSTLELGTIATQDANSVDISGGAISGVTLESSNVTISGGTIVNIADIAIEDGGTGASTAASARINLGLAIGSDIQAYSSSLDQLSTAFDTSDVFVYASASGVISTASVGSTGLAVLSGSSASGIRSTIGLGTLATQNSNSISVSGGTISGVVLTANNVTISGGTITAITDLSIEDGGTGASDAATARDNLGLTIGSGVQAYSAVLDGIAGAYDVTDNIAYASASGVVATTTLTSLGRTLISQTAASGVRNELSLASMALQDASSVAISGGTISGVTFISGSVTISGGTIVAITDLAIEDGGTGASTASGARTNLGLAIGTDVQAYSAVLSGVAGAYDTADNIAYASASGVVATTTLTSLGRTIVSQTAASGIRNELSLGSMALQEASSVAISGGTISGITDLAIEDGGTGASSAAAARTNLGLAIGTDVQAYDAGLASIAGLTTSADQLLYLTAEDTYATSPLVEFTRGFLASGNSASDARDLLGLGFLATQSIVSSGGIDSGVIVGSMVASGALIADNYGAESIVTAVISGSAVTTAKIADDAVTAAKLGDSSSTIVALGAPLTAGSFIGQQYIDEATFFAYVWDGSAWTRHAALASIDFADSSPLAFSVAYPDANTATITTTVDNQAANTVWAGPASGVDAAPAFRNLVAEDLPLATDSAVGAVQPGAGLSVDGNGLIGHTNVAETGVYTGAITIDAQGHIVSAQASLQASDIPDLDASKITTGTFGSSFLAENSVTASQLADYGIAQVSESAPTPEFAGQWWINPNDRSAYIWVGEVSPVPNGYWLNLGYGSPTQINLRFGGTYNASGNVVESINSYGIEAGLTVGQSLSAPNTSNNGIYLIVTASGVGTAPAPAEALTVGNWVLSQGVGASWTKVDLTSPVAGVADQDVLVAGALLNPPASGIASQEDFNETVWPRVQVATSGAIGVVRGSTEIVVASGTGIMTIGETDEGLY